MVKNLIRKIRQAILTLVVISRLLFFRSVTNMLVIFTKYTGITK